MTRSREPGWPVVAPALVVPLVGALVYFVWFPEGAAGRTAYAATKVFTLIYPLVLLRVIGMRGLVRREPPVERRPSWQVIVWTGLGSGLAIAGFGTLLLASPLGPLIEGGSDEVEARVEGLGFAEHFVLFAIFLSFFHSALEEYYWRWFVYGRLREKLSRPLAHGLAALAFAAHHVVVTLHFFPPGLAIFLAASVAVGGLIWSLLYEWHGTTVGCWLSHVVVDIFLMVVGYRWVVMAG